MWGGPMFWNVERGRLIWIGLVTKNSVLKILGVSNHTDEIRGSND